MDYVKVGIPLTAVVIAIVIRVTPLFQAKLGPAECGSHAVVPPDAPPSSRG